MNKPQLIWNRFPKKPLTLIFVGVAIGIMTPIPKALIAILAGLGIWLLWRYGRDTISLLIWARAFFQKARYEPTRRDVFRMDIK